MRQMYYVLVVAAMVASISELSVCAKQNVLWVLILLQSYKIGSILLFIF